MVPPGSASLPGYRISPADPRRDEEAVLSVWEGSLEDCGAERFRRIYRDNPLGEAWGWMALDGNGAGCVGFGGLCPRRVTVGGRAVIAAAAVDFAVKRGHRGLGPALQLQKAVASSHGGLGLGFVYGLPGDRARGVFQRIGYRTVGEMVRWTRVLRSACKLEEYLRSPAVAKAVSRLVDPLLAARFPAGRVPMPQGVRVAPVTRFDGRFDGLQASAKGPFTVAGDRSAQFLRWRYGDPVRVGYRVFSLVEGRDGRLLGYVVYSDGDAVRRISDFLALDCDATLSLLLDRFVDRSREEGIAAVSVSYLGCAGVRDRLRGLGFVPREDTRPFMIFSGEPARHGPDVFDADKWHLLEADDI